MIAKKKKNTKKKKPVFYITQLFISLTGALQIMTDYYNQRASIKLS